MPPNQCVPRLSGLRNTLRSATLRTNAHQCGNCGRPMGAENKSRMARVYTQSETLQLGVVTQSSPNSAGRSFRAASRPSREAPWMRAGRRGLTYYRGIELMFVSAALAETTGTVTQRELVDSTDLSPA